MGFINLAEKTVHAKLVYYGIGAGGKTTSLQAVHGIMCPSNEVKLVSINTEEDATLLFDFLPISLGTIEGFQVIIQGFTVPGQPKYKRMRKYVLQGADAVVFVVDSQRSRLEENIEALEGLLDNLKLNGLDPATIPIVIQYNKRDLDDILSEEEMNPHFLVREDIQAFPSVATESQGVYETFVHAASQLVETKIKQYDLGKGATSPEKVSAGARDKLWAIFDEYRSQEEERKKTQVLEFTVDEGPERPQSIVGGAAEDSVPETDTETGTGDDRIDLGGEKLSLDADSLGLVETDRDSLDFRSGLTEREKPRLEFEDDFIAGLDEVSDHEAVDAYLDGTPDGELNLEFDNEMELGDATVEGDPLLSDEIFTDEDLDVDLDAVEEESDRLVVDDNEAGLLDMALQSNLQLAEAFGELDQFKAKLRRKNEELIKIAQNTIHDLNKPLSAIKLMLTSAVRGYLGDLNGNLGAGIENALAAVKMMERLIGDLMDSMVLDTSFRMQFGEVDMTIMVSEVIRTLRYPIEDHDVGIRIEPLPTVMADEWALTKAFMNLIGNAIQYASPERPPRIWISYEDHDGFHRFTIADNGIGIPEGQREKLFLRFERGSNVTGISGTGLGLHIVKEAVMGHGGHIKLRSTEGEGTTFDIYLPKVPVEVPQCEVTPTVRM